MPFAGRGPATNPAPPGLWAEERRGPTGREHDEKDSTSRDALRGRARGRRRERPGHGHASDGQGSRLAQLRRLDGPHGLLRAERRRRVAGLRRGAVPRGGRGRARRPAGGDLRAALAQDALHRAVVGRGRRAVAQHHLDLPARQRAQVRVRRRQLLRRPGLHGPEGAGRHLRQGSRRRHGLHPDRHHHRAQPRRLLPLQQHGVQPGPDRDRRRGPAAVPRRRLRRLHHRPLGAGRDPGHLPQPRRSRDPARADLQGAAGAARAPGRLRVGRRRALDAQRADRRRGVRRDLRQRRRPGRGGGGQPRGQPPARHRGEPGRDDERAAGLGRQGDRGGGQLRRALRALPRRVHPDRPLARAQRASTPMAACSTRRRSGKQIEARGAGNPCPSRIRPCGPRAAMDHVGPRRHAGPTGSGAVRRSMPGQRAPQPENGHRGPQAGLEGGSRWRP